MKLRHKKQKIRDLFVYNTSIIPVSVKVHRHEVIITVNNGDLEHRGLSEESVIELMNSLTGRKIKIKQLESDLDD